MSKHRALALFPSLLLSAGFAYAAGNTNNVAGSSIFRILPTARIQLADFDQFNMIEREMQYLVSQRGDHKNTNHFCAVGYRFADGDVLSVVIWKNKDWLIRWEGGIPDRARMEFRYASSLFFSRAINLKTDLVETMEYGGTGLEVRAHAEGTVADCERYGKQYAIEPFEIPDDDAPWVPSHSQTALMQRVNQAYAAGHLLQLLELQLEVEQIDTEHVAGLSNERLKHYNQVLNGQLQEIKMEVEMVQVHFKAEFGLSPYEKLTPKKLSTMLAADVSARKYDHLVLERQLTIFTQDPSQFKGWLKDDRLLYEGQSQPLLLREGGFYY